MLSHRFPAGGPVLLLALLAGASGLAGCADMRADRDYIYAIDEPPPVVYRPPAFERRAPVSLETTPVAEERTVLPVRRRTRTFDPGPTVIDSRYDSGDQLDFDENEVDALIERDRNDMYGGVERGANSHPPGHYKTE